MNNMKSIKTKDIVRNWHLVDANGQILGRLATQAAQILMGKTKAYYSTNLDTGDFVVVINASKVALSGKKEKQKIYYHHSGFPGGMKQRTVSDVRKAKPEMLIRHAIKGMLPKTKMGKLMLKKLYVYPEDEHPHKEKIVN
jgi:large subunit ribosomal protein L13